jgi:predicted GIY-YIG superfamily endonuclease
MIMGIIYCLTSPSKKKYVGQTERELGKRIKEHCTSTGCIALYAAIQNIWN